MTRLVSGEPGLAEPGDRALRPQTLSEFVGQAAAKSNLTIFIDAARGRGEAMDHVLLFGPPGLGKTTLAQIIARELGVNFRTTSGPVLAKAGDLVVTLEEIEARASQAIEDGKARLAEAARVPKPPSPADLARQRLAAMARRHGAEDHTAHAPLLQNGPLLQSKLLGILQPKPDVRTTRAKAIGNIWENWPAVQLNTPEPDDSEE